MISTHARRAGMLALAALLFGAGDALAQRGRPQAPVQRAKLWLTGWGGDFTKFGGFSDGEPAAFFHFEDAIAYGGGLHYMISPSILIGVDGLYSKPEFVQLDLDSGDELDRGDATVASGLVSARLLAGGGGALGLYLTGGVGVFAYDVPILGERDSDFAFEAGIGLEYGRWKRFGFFGEYGQFWVYHQKTERSTSNKTNHTLFKLGLRVGI
jgi:hypothetical protein